MLKMTTKYSQWSISLVGLSIMSNRICIQYMYAVVLIFASLFWAISKRFFCIYYCVDITETFNFNFEFFQEILRLIVILSFSRVPFSSIFLDRQSAVFTVHSVNTEMEREEKLVETICEILVDGSLAAHKSSLNATI